MGDQNAASDNGGAPIARVMSRLAILVTQMGHHARCGARFIAPCSGCRFVGAALQEAHADLEAPVAICARPQRNAQWPPRRRARQHKVLVALKERHVVIDVRGYAHRVVVSGEHERRHRDAVGDAHRIARQEVLAEGRPKACERARRDQQLVQRSRALAPLQSARVARLQQRSVARR